MRYLLAVAQRLRLKPVVVCTAMVYVRRLDDALRLLDSNSNKRDDVDALACLLLACKVEESGIHIEYLLDESSKVDGASSSFSSSPPQERRDLLIAREERALKLISFKLVVEHAQPIATEVVAWQFAATGDDSNKDKRDALVKLAHGALQDYLMVEPRYEAYPPRLLALAAVSLSIKYHWFVNSGGSTQDEEGDGAGSTERPPELVVLINESASFTLEQVLKMETVMMRAAATTERHV